MNELIPYDTARRAIIEATTIDEAKDIADKAEALRLYAKKANNPELEIAASEIRCRAVRRIGEISLGLEKNAGRPSAKRIRPNSGTNYKRETLKSGGISKSAAGRAEQVANIPVEEFEAYIAGRKKKGKPTPLNFLYLKARQKKSRDSDPGYPTCTVDDLAVLAESGKKFSVIYADPPWEFKVYSGEGKARSAEKHYPTKSLDRIKTLPVVPLAADNCALFLWCVMPEIPGALEIIKAWGFEYKTVAFTWIKQNRGGEGIFTGMGYWTRANAELCLLATRGSPVRLAEDVHQIVSAPVARHSEKPGEVRERITRLITGPYLELYGRCEVEDWTVWGNEISQKSFSRKVA